MPNPPEAGSSSYSSTFGWSARLYWQPPACRPHQVFVWPARVSCCASRDVCWCDLALPASLLLPHRAAGGGGGGQSAPVPHPHRTHRPHQALPCPQPRLQPQLLLQQGEGEAVLRQEKQLNRYSKLSNNFRRLHQWFYSSAVCRLAQKRRTAC